jgi:hypothetical protein
MDTKSFGCLVPNPWAPRLLTAWFQIHDQDFWLLGSKSMTKTFDHLAWGSHNPPFVAIRNLANISITHLGNQTWQSHLPRDYFLPWHSPGLYWYSTNA